MNFVSSVLVMSAIALTLLEMECTRLGGRKLLFVASVLNIHVRTESHRNLFDALHLQIQPAVLDSSAVRIHGLPFHFLQNTGAQHAFDAHITHGLRPTR